ncbi:nucleoside phosphorylase domain-containing protein [Xylariales sp. PMI_506]|nr:nucleoside phosphorylase domain-containing protein [Xylariales sp. PMI_506]
MNEKDDRDKQKHNRLSTSPKSPTHMLSPSLRPQILEPQKPFSRLEFKVAIVCALTLEADAIISVFDQHWNEVYDVAHGDTNGYTFGTIGRHNIVLVHMPGPGKARAASAASSCHLSFPSVTLCIVAGVCGGIPRKPDGEEVLLGDTVVSEGIVQYDYGRHYSGGFKRKNSGLDNLPRPNAQLASLLSKLKGQWSREALQVDAMAHLGHMQQHPKFGRAAQYPLSADDRLFAPTYQHKHHAAAGCAECESGDAASSGVCERALEASCEELRCDSSHVVRWSPRNSDISGSSPRSPVVHFGLYGSGDIVMKSGEERDRTAKREGIVAFEMEAAGVWDSFPACLVIKGISDYADSHKNKAFQRYSAASAAAYTKAILAHWNSNH